MCYWAAIFRVSLNSPRAHLLRGRFVVTALMARSKRGREHRKAKGAKSHQRLDIQGLRMVAVLLVVVSHLFGWPRGGFIGVDIFFVISGFVITASLMREHDRSGKISFDGFYRRRARRILPVSFLVLGATVTASYVLLLSDRFHSVVSDALWSLAFLVNWHLAAAGTDYFQAALPPSPLQHYWSLAVEEQFYLAWPLLIVGLLFAAKRWRKGLSLQPFVIALAATIIVISFGWAMYQSSAEPTVAYFSTFTRAWELASGALLAASATYFTRLTPAARNVMAAVGLIGIFGSAFFIDPAFTFPAPIGAVPIVSVCLVIAAGIGVQSVKASWVLTLRPAIYIGGISYSLYLWHWPVIVLLASLMDTGVTYYITAIALMSVLTVASYHLVENPILASKFLVPTPDHKRLRNQNGRRNWTPSKAAQNITLGGLSVAAVLLTIVAMNPAPPPSGGVARQVVAAEVPDVTGSDSDPLTIEIQQALDMREFPVLNPSLDGINAQRADQMQDASGCFNAKSMASASQCTYGKTGSDLTAVVVGDSVGVSWMPGVVSALTPLGYEVRAFGLSDCPFIESPVSTPTDPARAERCSAGRPLIYDEINRLRPDVVIVSDFEAGITKLASGATGSAAQAEWKQARTESIANIAASGAKVVILSSNPQGKAPTECATRLSSPSDCVSKIARIWNEKRDADRSAAEATGAKYVDTSQWFCVGDRCPVFVSAIPVRWDVAHLTTAYAEYLAPRIADAVTT